LSLSRGQNPESKPGEFTRRLDHRSEQSVAYQDFRLMPSESRVDEFISTVVENTQLESSF
jgi:hypothetical protein